MCDSVTTIEVFTYTIDRLKRLICNCKHVDAGTVDSSLHMVYFEEYFKELDAKTIVIENVYIDRDYLDDFAGYYVRCFRNYDKECRRIHFFTNKFQQESFDNLIKNRDNELTEKKLQNCYIGFIVLKPLPKAVIGRTCLKVYDKDKVRRHYPVTRTYQAHIAGIKLKVESLAFQQQDSVAAACATSALWSVFHGTSKVYDHIIPSPLEITNSAKTNSPTTSRILPNIEGLTDFEMAKAIKSVGLEPYLINLRVPSNHLDLKKHLYAFMRSRTPMILAFSLFDYSNGVAENPGANGAPAKHAVALTGFNIDPASSSKATKGGFLTRASRIDKVYMHDDGIGPFARMELFNGKLNFPDAKRGVVEHVLDFFKSSWRGFDQRIGSMIAIPELLLIPVYHKIRIRFDKIYEIAYLFDYIIELWRVYSKWQNKSGRLEWDIYLTNVNDFKTSLRDNCKLDQKYALAILKKHMPRYLWRATACLNGDSLIDLIFDATDIEQGEFINCIVEYDTYLADELRNFKIPADFINQLKPTPVWDVYTKFINKT